MKWISFILFFPVLATAKININNGMVQPFSLKKYSVSKFVEDYAEALEKPVLADLNLSNKKGTISFEINKEIDTETFEKMFFTILESKGLTAVVEGSFLRIIESRDIRYTATSFHTSEMIPETDEYTLVFHRLKFPVAFDITRNMRPFMSRYGRIIDFGDAHSIAINDRGNNIRRLIQIMNSLDNKESLEKLIRNAKKEKHTKNGRRSDSREKNYESEILKLEKKLIEYKLKEKGGE